MTVLDIVNTKTTNTAITDSEKEIAIAEVEQVIKNYCNINSVPEELNFTWANMVVDLVRFQNTQNSRDEGDEEDITVHSGDISSLKIGDTSVNIGSGSPTDIGNRAIKSHVPDLDSLLMNYREQLQRFRRMVW